MPWPSSAVNSGPRRLSPPPRITETYRNSQPTCSTAFWPSPADRPDLQSQAEKPARELRHERLFGEVLPADHQGLSEGGRQGREGDDQTDQKSRGPRGSHRVLLVERIRRGNADAFHHRKHLSGKTIRASAENSRTNKAQPSRSAPQLRGVRERGVFRRFDWP